MPTYPLEQVLTVKKRRVEAAEEVVKEKKKALELEQEKLKQREAERDAVKKHYKDKLKQMRDELDQQTTTDKIQQMKVYLKVVLEKLTIEEKKVSDQKDQVTLAEKNLNVAQMELKQRRLEVDKMNTHKQDWLIEQRKEEEIQLAKVQDEIGTVMHQARKKRGM
jgi:hypothetical protein